MVRIEEEKDDNDVRFLIVIINGSRGSSIVLIINKKSMVRT